jgi:hypothetical protein
LLFESPKLQPVSIDPKAANVITAACARKLDFIVTGTSS